MERDTDWKEEGIAISYLEDLRKEMQGVKIDYSRRYGEKSAIETVEHTTMSGQEPAAVFDS